ncbi:hypothetical protein Enr17x_51600 [Gimesia fumaroli]|uniref:Uncharacterized protein n=1 Tax=Gimesia fumaroli TaxID=2527976 RepID=A0A518IJ14_9PLAN|nr:hypothetical protein Enr17x_51600 [Gimesia fumaroli]
MTPEEFSARLGELGVSLTAADLPKVEALHISEEVISDIHVQSVAALFIFSRSVVSGRLFCSAL